MFIGLYILIVLNEIIKITIKMFIGLYILIVLNEIITF